MTKRVYWRQVSLSSFRYAGPYFYQTQEDTNALGGPFSRVLTEERKKIKGWRVGGWHVVFLHCEQMRSNPVLVFEVVVGFVSLFSHLILNILKMRVWSGRWAPPPNPSSYSSSSVGSSSSMSRSSPGMLRFWVTDAMRDTGLLSSSISAGSSFTWTWCLKQE